MYIPLHRARTQNAQKGEHSDLPFAIHCTREVTDLQFQTKIAKICEMIGTNPDEQNGRDCAGRFAPGNRLGRPNLLAGRVMRLRAKLLKAITPDDIEQVIRSVVEAAKRGDMAAAKLMLEYSVGKPQRADDSRSGRGPMVFVFGGVPGDGAALLPQHSARRQLVGESGETEPAETAERADRAVL